MKHFVAVQQLRVAAITTHTLQAISQFIALVDDDCDKRKRTKSPLQQRCGWLQFVLANKNTPLFCRHLRMTYDSFMALLDKIWPHLPQIDEEMAALRGGIIIPELRLYATIRYLAGGSYSDICFFCGISKPSFYRCLWETIAAINKAVKIKFPSTAEECALNASDFESVSHAGIISNCVGAVDGYLLGIVTPAKKHAKNVRSYFSGHYQKYGINIQACCDANCRFTFLGIGGPGVTKDRAAVKDSGLNELINNLPPGYICISDCAYEPTEHLVAIFGGDLALQKDNDNFNFYASQLRIRIEMAFGIMTRKWGILQRPLSIVLPQVKHLICAIARLHNFCIDEELKTVSASGHRRHFVHTLTRANLSPTQLAYMHASAQVRTRRICCVLTVSLLNLLRLNFIFVSIGSTPRDS